MSKLKLHCNVRNWDDTRRTFAAIESALNTSGGGTGPAGGAPWQQYPAELQDVAGAVQHLHVGVNGYWTQIGGTVLCRILCQPDLNGGVYGGIWYFTLPRPCVDIAASAILGNAFAWLETVGLNAPTLDPAGMLVLGVARIRGDDLSRVSAWVTSGTATIVQVAGNTPLNYTAAFTTGRLELTFSYPAAPEDI